MKRGIIVTTPKGKRYSLLRLGIGPFYAEKNGGSVLREEVTWRKLCGFWINTPWGCVWIHFRRWRLK